MATSAGAESRSRLIELLACGHRDDPDRFRALPDGADPLVPPGWLWSPTEEPHPATTFGLRDPRAYTHVLPGEHGVDGLLSSPDVTLAGRGREDAEARRYVRHSVDVTMKGGTTSGVVYPLAVCEIARRAVLRNVGGSSAGAIAAAGAAAAELGRARLAEDPVQPELTPEQCESGRVRIGFAGLADVTAWLAEADEDAGHEQHRLGQLFRPPQSTRAMFRVVAAIMQRQYSRIPLLLIGALGPVARTLTVLLLLGAPLLATWAGPGLQGWRGPVLAAAWCTALALVLIGGPVLLLLWRLGRTRPDARPAALREPVREPRPAPGPPIRLAATAVGCGLVALAMLPWLTRAAGVVLEPWPLITAWLLAALGVTAVQGAAVVRRIRNARAVRFGLVGGSEPPDAGALGTPGSWWDRVAGLPAPRVPSLTDWLTSALNDLAGLPEGEVLTFGHLWQGPSFSRTPDLDLLRRAARLPSARQVNLELMTSELVHRVPLRFPLQVEDVRDAGGETSMFVRRADLEGLLPTPVIDAICCGGATTAQDATSGRAVTDLCPLPMPWDLPVVFAVRMSLALPVLFQAVRLYRRVARTPAREDFGLRLARAGVELEYPGTPEVWVEELWLSDGGITSNFPIHFFDAVLPRWPTLGINLGDHPPGSAHQDVWLPSDADRVEVPARPLDGSMLSFLSGVLNTGLNWRDALQTVMPAFRGRVATVRTQPGEGGSNLYMNREQVSGLALRGALAGVRLSRRFSADAHWRRHEYLRARVGLGNLAALSESVRRSLVTGGYADWGPDGAGLLETVKDALATACDPGPPRPTPGSDLPMPWYPPPEEFWTTAPALLHDVAAGPTAGLVENLPQPAPELKQVPRQ